ncbi:MAG: hypothetical protein P1P88_06175 [Bacteroidales bacterium]|nr:hypothetical protein [Bacteroidales bacterium]
MKKSIRKSMILFLSFGLFMMIGHGIIPHHHHSDSIYSHKESHCPTDKQDQKSRQEAPFHCHAFNDTDWFKQNNSSVKLSKIAFLFLSICASRMSYPLQTINKIKFIHKYSILKEAPLLKLHFPRPPPHRFN